MFRLPLLAALSAIIFVPRAPAPSLPRGPCLAEALPDIRGARTREDSLALAARYEGDPPGGDRMCGNLLAGLLIGLTATAAEDTWRERQRGLTLLEAALRDYGDEPRVYLAMGLLQYHRQARTGALRNLARALERKDDAEVPMTEREVAVVYYNRGLIHQDFWRDWRSFGALEATSGGQWHCGRYEVPTQDNFSSSSDDHTWLINLNQLCHERFAENMATYFEPRADMNREDFDRLEEAFEDALEADGTFIPAVDALLGEYVYLEMWERAERLVRALRQRLPDAYQSYLYHGLVLHETGRDSLAAPEFAKSFLRMPDSVRAALEDITSLLEPEQQVWFQQADEATRLRAVTAYWNSLDPLYLTTVNERKLEHYARVVAADLMLGSPALRERGAESYAGQIWIRYGRPNVMWELKIPPGRVVFWDYGPGPDVSFTRGSNYRSFRATDEAKQYTNQLQRSLPQSYAPSAVIDTTERLGHQVVRLLGADLAPQFLVYAEWPADYAPESSAGLTLLDPQFLPVAQWRGGKPDRPGIRAELQGMAPGAYSLTVEVHDRAARRLGRVRDTLSTLAIDDSAFVVSDLLLASDIASRVGSGAVARREMEIVPLYGSMLPRGAAMGLYWEVYRLVGSRDGRIAYQVSIEVQDATRRPILARVLGGVGVGAGRTPATKIEYDSERPLRAGRAVEWVELTGELSAGEYRIVLTVVDRETGSTVVRERTLSVE